MKYFIPAKTFLLGEYSALVGGEILGLATKPGFSVEYSDDLVPEFPFSEESPAAVLKNKIGSPKFQFRDDIGFGGFGKSTAEYLSVLLPNLKKTDSFAKIRKDYLYHSEASGARVSGMDLAIQYFGQVTHYNQTQDKGISYPWAFSGYDFILISTGMKIKTHEHLQTIDRSTLSSFPKVSDPLVKLFFSSSPEDFIRGLNEWTLFLTSQELVHPHSIELLQGLSKDPSVLAAKPCGAWGADVIAVICKSESTPRVKHNISELGLTICATTQDLSSGIQAQLEESALGSKADYVG